MNDKDFSVAKDRGLVGRLPQSSESNSFMRGGIYEIKVSGLLDEHWSQWLDDLAITHDIQGNTLLAGHVPDQAALHGILARIRDLGLFLISLNCIER